MQKKSLSSFAAGLTFAVVLLGASKVLHADPPPSFAPGETLSAAKLNGALTSLSARLDAVEKSGPQAAVIPPGTISAFAGNTVPVGWKLCDGSSVSRTDSAALFAVIGTGWGTGDGSTTFNLPDLRGRFLRGVDRGTNRDPDRAARKGEAPGQNVGDEVGSLEDDALRNHSHPYTFGSAVLIGYTGGGAYAYSIAHVAANTGAASGVVSTETRPKNANVNYIIKE